jgi:hypothetical protein
MSDEKVDRREKFMAGVKRRPGSSEPDLVIVIRDEPARGARWSSQVKVILSSGQVVKGN